MAGPRRTSSASSMDVAALNSSNGTDAHSGSSSSSTAAPSAAAASAAAAAAAKKKKAGLVKQMSAREVRTRLRQLGKPITLYGETDSERSARLVAAEAEEHNDDFNLGAGHETRYALTQIGNIHLCCKCCIHVQRKSCCTQLHEAACSSHCDIYLHDCLYSMYVPT
jgi:hypothetical protein